MTIQDAIDNRLLEWLPLVSLIESRLDQDEIPSSGRAQRMPRLVRRRVSKVPAHDYGPGSRPQWWTDRFQFEAWAESRAECEAVGDALIDAAHDMAGKTVGAVVASEDGPEQAGVRIGSVQVAGDFDAVARELKKFVRIVDIKFQFKREG